MCQALYYILFLSFYSFGRLLDPAGNGRFHPFSNLLSRALGRAPGREPAIVVRKISLGDSRIKYPGMKDREIASARNRSRPFANDRDAIGRLTAGNGAPPLPCSGRNTFLRVQ